MHFPLENIVRSKATGWSRSRFPRCNYFWKRWPRWLRTYTDPHIFFKSSHCSAPLVQESMLVRSMLNNCFDQLLKKWTTVIPWDRRVPTYEYSVIRSNLRANVCSEIWVKIWDTTRLQMLTLDGRALGASPANLLNCVCVIIFLRNHLRPTEIINFSSKPIELFIRLVMYMSLTLA